MRYINSRFTYLLTYRMVEALWRTLPNENKQLLLANGADINDADEMKK